MTTQEKIELLKNNKMKYKMTNEIKQLEYLKACEFSRNGLTKKEIIERTSSDRRPKQYSRQVQIQSN